MEIQQKMENATEMTSDVLTNYLPFTLRRSYVERKVHITEMDEILQKDGLCILCGDGDSGKSTLAMHYALKQQRDSMESNERPFLVVRILQEATKTNLLQELQRMGRELKINDEIIEKETKQDIQEYCRELTRLIYNQLSLIGQQLIFILDNPQDSSVLKYCNHYRHRSGQNVQLLVTTRNHHAFPDHKNSQITLSTFTCEEGETYLRQRLIHQKSQNKEKVRKNVSKLLTTVGRSPLRLRLASGYLQTNRAMTVDEYVKLYRSANPPDGVLPEVQLALNALDSMSQLVMHCSTKLETSYIPLDLFQHLLNVNEEKLRKEIIGPLENLSLATVLLGRDDNGYGIQIHDKVRASCRHYRKWKGKAKMSERSLLNHIVSTVSKKMPYADFVGDDNWQQAQLYAPQGTKVVEHAENVLGKNVSFAKLFCTLGQYESLLCNFQQSLTYREKALKIYQQLYGDKPHSDVAISLSKIGSAHKNLGSIDKVRDYYEQALKIYQQLHGNKPHVDVALSLDNIGAAYYNLGDIQKSLDNYQQSIKLYQQLHGDKPHSDVAASLNTIGDVYYDLDDIQNSLQYYEQSV